MDTSMDQRDVQRDDRRDLQRNVDRYLALLDADADRLLTVAELGLDADVPTCPGWRVADAVMHTSQVYQHKIACMRLLRQPSETEYVQQPPDGISLLEWFRDS